MNPFHVLKRAHARGGSLDLTSAEADALAPHLDLLHDLHLLIAGTDAQLKLSVLGVGLMSQLVDLDNLVRQDGDSWVEGYRDGYSGAPSTPAPVGLDRLAWASGRIEGAADRAAGKPSAHAEEPPAPGM